MRQGLRGIGIRALLLLLLLPEGNPAAASSVESTGQPDVEISGTARAELSGLTHVSDGHYLAVSDRNASLYPLEIEIDASTGFVTRVSAGPALRLAGGGDLEAIVSAPDGSVLVADERTSSIRRHDPSDGRELGRIAVPAIFARFRPNQGLESLALDAFVRAGDLWTANEAALRGDGPLPNTQRGTWIRLQRFDATGAPSGQWAYETEPVPGPDVGKSGRRIASGVVEVLALPSDRRDDVQLDTLLVLERHAGRRGLFPFIDVALFAVTLQNASDVAALPSLESEDFRPVPKRRLYADPSGLRNFEAMALGPRLDDGSRSLLLLAEGSDLLGTEPVLRSLRWRP